jgi:hypothetical protein
MCAVFINDGEYDKISRILSCSVLRNLWPTLLLHYFHNLPHELISNESKICQKSINICESINTLLNKCCYIQYEYNEPILVNLNTSLNCELTIVKWILKHRKKYPMSVIDQNLSVKYIFIGLQNNCTLTVLKKCIDIHECDFKEIENLLKDKKQTMKVFKSYLIMQTALKAILMCEFYNSHIKQITGSLYTQMESLLNVTSPLNLRLELIENIFSMLFLRHNAHFDIAEGTSEEEDYDTALSEEERHSSAYESRESDKHRSYGFICNKYSVNQLLRYLKRCTVQIGIDFAKLRRENKITMDLNELQKNIFNIDKAITDALWRLELLTSLEFIENKDNVNNSYASSSDLDKTLDEKHSFTFRLKTKSIFYNQRTESSSEENKCNEKSDVDGSSETGSTDTNNAINKRRRKNKNHVLIMEPVDVPIKHTNWKLIINLMLASKESLVIQCLWKGDYAKAQQVIEVCIV